MNQLHLTKFRIGFPFTAPTRIVRESWLKAKVDEKWKESVWAKKVANKEKVGWYIVIIREFIYTWSHFKRTKFFFLENIFLIINNSFYIPHDEPYVDRNCRLIT